MAQLARMASWKDVTAEAERRGQTVSPFGSEGSHAGWEIAGTRWYTWRRAEAVDALNLSDAEFGPLHSDASWEVVIARARRLGLRVQDNCDGYAIAGVRYIVSERPLAIDKVNAASQAHGEEEDSLSSGALPDADPDRASVAHQMRQLFGQ